MNQNVTVVTTVTELLDVEFAVTSFDQAIDRGFKVAGEELAEVVYGLAYHAGVLASPSLVARAFAQYSA